MRLITVLLLSVAIATSAGCFGKDKGGETTTTPTPATGSGMTPPTGGTTSGTPSATPTPGGGTNGTTKPAPREVFSGSATFTPSPGAPDPANPTGVLGAPVDTPFTVTAGFTSLTLNVTWANGAPAAVVSGLSVSVLDATGATIAACSVPQGPVQGTPAACTQAGTIPAAGGAYTARYSGSAPPNTVTAAVSVMAA